MYTTVGAEPNHGCAISVAVRLFLIGAAKHSLRFSGLEKLPRMARDSGHATHRRSGDESKDRSRPSSSFDVDKPCGLKSYV